MKSGYKWLLLGLLSLAFFFNQADRVLFGLLTIPIQEEFGLTDLQIGFVNTALFVIIAITVPLAGFLGDRFSRGMGRCARLVEDGGTVPCPDRAQAAGELDCLIARKVKIRDFVQNNTRASIWTLCMIKQ